ncbi:MAG: hypothetical protein K1000chlam1_01260 [Candidatus Anoxychlamydiales bacterium]|nr:hypothetical protein [Candidatus Anoxychlamydiales bacterium]
MYKKNVILKVLFTLIGVLFISSAHSIPKGPCDEVMDVCCEEAVGPFAFSYPKDVGLSCPRDFYVHGEFLWMKPSEEGLEYAIDQNDPASSAHTFELHVGKIKGFSRDSDEWDWKPGFRAGFGFYGMQDQWQFAADWTYLRIKADSDVTNGGFGTLLGLFLPPIGTLLPALVEMSHASARWSGNYNTMDIMIGKPYHVSRYFISNPMFGIRTGWIDQDYHVRYYINNVERSVWLKNDFWGAGLRGYYEGQFLLGSGWSIYGKAAFALLFSKFDISQESDITIGNVIISREQQYKTEDSFYSVQPNAELGMGISFSKYYHKNQYQVSLKVGYEFHHWWDQNQARKFFDQDPAANDTVSRGDLSFNGFMFGLHFEF